MVLAKAVFVNNIILLLNTMWYNLRSRMWKWICHLGIFRENIFWKIFSNHWRCIHKRASKVLSPKFQKMQSNFKMLSNEIAYFLLQFCQIENLQFSQKYRQDLKNGQIWITEICGSKNVCCSGYRNKVFY